VLYVEDDAHDFFLLHVANHRCGAPFAFYRAEDGAQAISYLKGSGSFGDRETFPFPALVLLDLRMPYLDGFEVLQWIRTNPHASGLPVAVLAGSGFRADMRRALELGATICLAKPSDPAKLRLVIHQLKSIVHLPPGATRRSDGGGLRAT
jgi:CheY-like chemotaxis protein